MSEFVGRGPGGRPYSYPETPRGGGLSALARNFASGPGQQTAITQAGIQIPWGSIDVSGSAPEVHSVPITPQVSGEIVIRAALGVQNTSGNPAVVIVEVQLNGVSVLIPLHEEFTVPTTNGGGEETNGFVEVPVLTKFTIPVGTTAQIQIKVTALTADVLSLTANNSTLEVEEVLPSTG